MTITRWKRDRRQWRRRRRRRLSGFVWLLRVISFGNFYDTFLSLARILVIMRRVRTHACDRPRHLDVSINTFVRSYVTFARVLGTLSVYPIIITISFRQLSCTAQLFGVFAVILCRPHVSYGVTRRLYKRLKRNATVSCLSRRRRSRSRRRITVKTSTRKFNSNGRHWDGGCYAKVKKIKYRTFVYY